jgi:hypothetical protein
MATDKTYSVCGISKMNGEYKIRWGHDVMRIKILHREGHEDIRLADLGGTFPKYKCVEMIKTHQDFADAAAQAVITEYLEDKAPKAARPAVNTAPASAHAEA